MDAAITGRCAVGSEGDHMLELTWPSSSSIYSRSRRDVVDVEQDNLTLTITTSAGRYSLSDMRASVYLPPSSFPSITERRVSVHTGHTKLFEAASGYRVVCGTSKTVSALNGYFVLSDVDLTVLGPDQVAATGTVNCDMKPLDMSSIVLSVVIAVATAVAVLVVVTTFIVSRRRRRQGQHTRASDDVP